MPRKSLLHLLAIVGFASLPSPTLLALSSSSNSARTKSSSVCMPLTGRFVSYYGTVFYVKNCQRFELDAEQVYGIMKEQKAIQEISSEQMAELSYGGVYQENAKTAQGSVCEKFNHRYITFSYGDVYWVEKCKKRPFPDWASYESHRGKLQNLKGGDPLMALTLQEFDSIPQGTPMPSVIDAEFRNLLANDNIDILPLEVACKGLLGQHVSYAGNLYRIEPLPGPKASAAHCQKRSVDAEAYTRQFGAQGLHPAELSSSQGLSIPDAKETPEQQLSSEASPAPAGTPSSQPAAGTTAEQPNPQPTPGQSAP